MKAAKEKTFFLLVLIATALLSCATATASSTHVLGSENRAEKIYLGGLDRIEQSALGPANHVEFGTELRMTAPESLVAPKSVAHRALRAEDVAAIKNGSRIKPKSTTGDILDHIQGRDSKYLSISMTKNGTANYVGPHGVAEIDLDIALKTGSGLVPHKQVLQIAKKRGTPRDVKNVADAMEALLTNGLDPKAIIRIIGSN